MSYTPETHEAVERWQQGKINIFDEMARLECERNQWRADCLEQCKLIAMSADREVKLRAEIAGWENKWKCAVELAALAKVKLHDREALQ